MSYLRAKRMECSEDYLQSIFEQESCPNCRGNLIQVCAELYCEKCDVVFFNDVVNERFKHPKRKYVKYLHKETIPSNR